MADILYVHDQPSPTLVIEETLSHAGHETVDVDSIEAALELIPGGGIDVIIADLGMRDAAGLEFLSVLQQFEYDIPLIVVTGYASILSAVSSVKAGVIQYVTKPIQPQQLELTVAQALEFVRLRRENARLRFEVTQLTGTRGIIGKSPQLKRALQTLRMAAPTRAPILLQGDAGTGKELLARAIHNMSPRHDEPFVTINCAVIPERLVERTLFGDAEEGPAGIGSHVLGALQRAHRGTLLLDDVTEMSSALQVKLLHVIEQHEFEPVGATDPVDVDVRIIASTNRDLSAQVELGDFQEALYRRLCEVCVRVPPLRERRGDIPLLAQHFAEQAAGALGKQLSGIAPEAMQMLQNYPWPGNVRELALAVERAVVLSPEAYLRPEAFSTRALDPPAATRAQLDRSQAEASAPPDPVSAEGGDGITVVLPSLRVAEAERVLIERALEAAEHNRTRAAELLGISARTLRNKLNKASKTTSP